MRLRGPFLTIAFVLALLFGANRTPLLFGQSNPLIQWQNALSAINTVRLKLQNLQAQITAGIFNTITISSLAGDVGQCLDVGPGGLIEVTGSACNSISGSFIAGTGIQLTGSNPTTIGTAQVPTGIFNIATDFGAVASSNASPVDVTTNIQSAINAACSLGGSSGPWPEIYLPATPNGQFYAISSPLLINCPLKFTGDGGTQTTISQNFVGPGILAQEAEPGWKPPIAASVTAPWAALTTYAQYKEVLDSNGNIEVATTGGTSGSGGHPTWPTSQGNTVSDGSVTWTLAMIGTQLLTGPGSALDAVSPEMWPGAGFGSNNATMEIGSPGHLENQVNGVSAFTVEFTYETMTASSGGGVFLVGVESSQPLPASVAAPLQIYTADSQGSCSFNCLGAIVNIGNTRVALQPNTTSPNPAVSAAHTHHIAVTYDGSNARLFLDGILLKTVAVSGIWTVGNYPSFMIADRGTQVYPGLQPDMNTPPAYYDSVRFSNSARYTANFAPPTAKFTLDLQTVALANWPINAPIGTTDILEQTQPSVGWGSTHPIIYVPIETSAGAADLNPVKIEHFTLLGAGYGIYANWMLNSTIADIQMGSNDIIGVFLHDNDYQDTIDTVLVQNTPGPTTAVAFVFGPQANNNIYDHLQCDGQQTCIEQVSGSGTYNLTDFSGRGVSIYPFVSYQGQGLWISPTTDDETSEPTELAPFYSNGGYAPVIIEGGQLTLSNTSGSYFAIFGGAPILSEGVDFNGAPAELLNVLSAPTGITQIHNAILPNSYTRTNAGNGQYLNVTNGDSPEETTSAARWSCMAINAGLPLIVTDVDTCSYGNTTTHTTGNLRCREGCTDSGGAFNWLAGQ